MHFSGFDFGPEALGMFLGMAEEMAEEKAQQIRTEYEMNNETDGEDEDADEYDFPDIEAEYAPSYKNPVRKKPMAPFEQFVDDYIHGRKTIDDPMDCGYDFRELVPRPAAAKGNPPFWIDCVQVFQSHLVSNQFLKLIGQILRRYPGNRIRRISFSAKGYPLQNGEPVFAVYIRKNGAVIFNLLRHFENGARVALTDPGYSIRALIWYSMLHSLLHELHHSLQLEPGGEETEAERQLEEEEAERWCINEVERLAKSIDLEPPPITEEPFFHACLNDLMIREINDGNRAFVDKQKLLIDTNLMYWDENSHAAIETMAAFLGSAPIREGAAPHDEKSRQDLFDADRRLKARLQKHIEIERALQEACEKGYHLRIDYQSREGRLTTGRIIHPKTVYDQDGLTYVNAFCEIHHENRLFRIDRIKMIAFIA